MVTGLATVVLVGLTARYVRLTRTLATAAVSTQEEAEAQARRTVYTIAARLYLVVRALPTESEQGSLGLLPYWEDSDLRDLEHAARAISDPGLLVRVVNVVNYMRRLAAMRDPVLKLDPPQQSVLWHEWSTTTESTQRMLGELVRTMESEGRGWPGPVKHGST